MGDPFGHVLTPEEAELDYHIEQENLRAECEAQEQAMGFFSDDAKVDECTSIYDACGLQLRAATTGPRGGDGGHGGWTGVILHGDGMMFDVRTGHGGDLDEECEADWIRIVCRGDAEGRVFAEGLRWLADHLEKEHGFTGPDAPPECADPAADPLDG